MEHVYNCIGHTLKIPDIVQSDGVYVMDENGNRYMDLEAGVWCVSVGHRNPRINKRISEQIDAIIQSGFSYASPIVDRAAKRILDITGLKNGKCVFLCSGSEAIEIGRQISKHLKGFKLSMTLHDSYLGAYSSVSDRTTGWYLFDWKRCANCERNSNCTRDCKLLKQIPEEISEFVFEPGSSSGYVRFPPASMIRNLIEIVRENGGKILVNEVTTGIGRTGKWFGYQHYDINPDIIAIGKGVGNGYPVSVAVLSEKMIKELEEKPFKYSQSHQNDPLGASVVKEVIDQIEEAGLISRTQRKGKRFLEQLEQLVDGHILTEVRGRGLMIAVDVRDQEMTERLCSQLLKQGYIVGNRGSFIRIDPPLMITAYEFDLFMEVFAGIVREIELEIQP
jgi:acetylornithine aminotransferase